MKTVKAIVLSALLVMGGVSNAHAIGDREQGALIGAGAIVLLGALFGSSSSGSSDTTYYRQAPVYYEPAPTVVYRQSYYPTTYYVPPRPVVRYYRHEHRGYYDNYPRPREYGRRGYY